MLLHLRKESRATHTQNSCSDDALDDDGDDLDDGKVGDGNYDGDDDMFSIYIYFVDLKMMFIFEKVKM